MGKQTGESARLASLKATVRQRDGMRCTECGLSNEEHKQRYHGRSLDVHRLDPGTPYTVEGCVTLCRRCHGPKPKSPRYSLPVQRIFLPRGLVLKMRTIASINGVSFHDYFHGLACPLVEADFQAIGNPPCP